MRKKKKLSVTKVQEAFNKAIVRRDSMCMVRNGDACSGGLQCSHFFPVGGNSGLRFYPYNAFAQCAGHHLAHHNRDPLFYSRWMQSHCPAELKWMESVRGIPVRYTQAVLAEIYEACNNDNLYEVRRIIRSLYVAESR